MPFTMDTPAAADHTRLVSLGGIVLMIAFIGACVVMHAVAQVPGFLLATGSQLLLYNVMSLAATMLLAASCSSLGMLLCRFKRNDSLDAFLLSAIAGLATFMVVGYLIGLLGLYTQWLCLAVLAVPLAFFPVRDAASALSVRKTRLIAALFLLLFVYLFTVSGVLAYIETNDFGHYLPMYGLALERGNLAPNIFYNAYFAAKGDGAGFLFMAATSARSVYYVSFLSVFLMLLMGYRYCRLLTASDYLALCFVLMLLATRVMRFEMYKSHAISSMFVLSIPFMISLRYLAARELRPAVFRASLCTVIGMLVITPVDGVFQSLPLVAGILLALMYRRRAEFRLSLALVVTALLVFVCMLTHNYFWTGLPEIKPFTLFFPLMDLARADRWIPLNTVISLGSISNSTGFVLRDKAFLLICLKIGAGLAALLAGFRLLGRRYPVRSRHYVVLLLPAVALFGLTAFLKVVTSHGSFNDHTGFESLLNRLLLVCGVLLLLSQSMRLVRSKTRLRPSMPRVFAVLFSILALHGMLFSWLPPARSQLAYASYFAGRQPLASTFALWRDPVADEVLRIVPPGAKIYPLYFSPYAYALPGRRFERPENSDSMRYLAQLLGRDAAASVRIYRELGIRYFLVVLWASSRRSEVTFPAFNVYQYYGSLFDTENVARYFRVRSLSGGRWLLVLDGGDADGVVPDAAFLAKYQATRAMDIALPGNYSITTLRVMRSKIPALAKVINPALDN